MSNPQSEKELFQLQCRKAGLEWASEPRYYVGVDLGQSRDPTAIAVVRRVEPPWPIPEDDFGLKPKLTYARGSVEWQAEQRHLQNNAAPE